MYIDHSLYPELDEPPIELRSAEEQGDYLHRVCCAWDFGIHPEPQTFDLFRDWRNVFDRFPCATSPGYHAFRAWFGWEPVPATASVGSLGSVGRPPRRSVRRHNLTSAAA
jgi:hypothetical protein